MQTGKSFEQEEEYITPDGNKKYMHVIRSPVIDSHETIIGTQGIMFDITETKEDRPGTEGKRRIRQISDPNHPVRHAYRGPEWKYTFSK